MSDRRRVVRYLKGQQTDKEFSRHLWNKIVQLCSMLNYFDNYRIVEGKARIANSTIAYAGTVRNVGAGQTYATLTDAYAAASNGDVLQLIDGTYDLDTESGGYWLVNTATKGVLVRGNAANNAAVVIRHKANAYGIRLRNCAEITFQNLTLTSDQNSGIVQQDNGYNSIYCRYINCILTNTNAGSSASIFSRVSSTTDIRNIWVEIRDSVINYSGSTSPVILANTGINEQLLITNTIINSAAISLLYGTSNKGNIALYDSNLLTSSNTYVCQFGIDGSAPTNTLGNIDLRNNSLAYTDSYFGHAILFGRGTDKVYCVNNVINIPSINNSLAIGFAVKTRSSSLGDSYFAGNYINAPRPFYIKGASNCIAKYNNCLSNQASWYGFDVVNPAADLLSSTNTVLKNNFAGNLSAIACGSSSGFEQPEVTMEGWNINQNKYFSTSGNWFRKSDNTDHLFFARATIYGNDNDNLSKMLSTYKTKSGITLIADDVVLN
jgi:hypothetical protein